MCLQLFVKILYLYIQSHANDSISCLPSPGSRLHISYPPWHSTVLLACDAPMDDDVMTFCLNLIASCQLCMAWLGLACLWYWCVLSALPCPSPTPATRFTTHRHRHGYPYGGSGDNRSHRSRINETPSFTTHISACISVSPVGRHSRVSYPVQFSTPAYCLSPSTSINTRTDTGDAMWGSSTTWHSSALLRITVELTRRRHLLGPAFFFIKT